MPKYISFLPVLCLLGSCAVFKPNIPRPRTEFRGILVATVANIDWPKNGIDNLQKQKQDFLPILNFYENLNSNAVIVKMRTVGDAFYESKHGPWSRFLTGKARENPYKQEDVLELILQYGTKYYYNPGFPEVQQKIVTVINEVVLNYDIDAIHFDDYFYPYTIKDEVFNDSITIYNCGRPNKDLANWRLSNVDSLIKKCNQTIKEIKPWVQLGISPFGVWKNNITDPMGPGTKAGQTAYEDLYVDPILWINEDWADYMDPRVYWSMDLPVASNKKILYLWSTKNNSTKLYVGNTAYKVRNISDTAWKNKKELNEEIALYRNTEAVSGDIPFSAKYVMYKNPDIVKYLQEKYYSCPALTPVLPTPKIIEPKVSKLTKVSQTPELIEINFVNKSKFKNALVYASGKKKQTNIFY